MDAALGELDNVIAELEYENENLGNTYKELQDEISELNDAIDSLLTENHELEVEAQNARRSFTGLQIAVSILVFLYGTMYGSYLCPK
jgi:regulator of replication initiation timing